MHYSIAIFLYAQIKSTELQYKYIYIISYINKFIYNKFKYYETSRTYELKSYRNNGSEAIVEEKIRVRTYGTCLLISIQ